MAEYIDRTQLEPDTEWSDYYDDFICYSQSQINSLPTADVIERSKIDKAIEEIKEVSFKHYFEHGEYIGEITEQCEVVKLNYVLEILKRNIGE